MPTQRSPFRRTIIAIATIAMAAALLAYQLTAFKRHFDTHVDKYRILRSLQELSSLRLHLTIKRDSMYVFGASQFDVFATPVTTTDGVSYGGIATFEDASTVHKYMLADNIAYHVTETSQNGSMTTQDVACLAPSDVPPVHEVKETCISWQLLNSCHWLTNSAFYCSCSMRSTPPNQSTASYPPTA